MQLLCRLTPDQWQHVNALPPCGVVLTAGGASQRLGNTPPDLTGYEGAGLYEGDDALWIVQYIQEAGVKMLRLWRYVDSFSPVGEPTLSELLELASEALDAARRLELAALRGDIERSTGTDGMAWDADALRLVAQDYFAQALLPQLASSPVR